jgi:hypothetical protein
MQKIFIVAQRGLAALVLVSLVWFGSPWTLSTAKAAGTNAGSQTSELFLPIVSAPDPTPPQSPQQIVYQNLRNEIYGQLYIYYQDMAAYRVDYLRFLWSQQYLNRDTTELQNDLNNFDSYISQSEAAQQAAKYDVGGNPGLDASGNVVNADV